MKVVMTIAINSYIKKDLSIVDGDQSSVIEPDDKQNYMALTYWVP